MKTPGITSAKNLFTTFFSQYFWIGVAAILTSALLDLKYPAPERGGIFSISIDIIEAIGLSILIASIFSWASGTSHFMKKIRSLLEDIVINREFLSNIDSEGKKVALKSLIQPTAAEKNKYPNIGDYYGFFIENTLDIASKNVRSNYQINARAFYDKFKGKVAIEGDYAYRLYPSDNGFNPITVGFEEPDNGPSFCSYVAVSDSEGKRNLFEKPEMETQDNGGDISRTWTIEVDDFGKEKNHLDVEIKVTEYGSDHWTLVHFKALQPTDGFKFKLRCEDGIKVKDHSIFVVGAKYYLDISKNKDELSISCNQWINEGTGLCILVGLPDYHNTQERKE